MRLAVLCIVHSYVFLHYVWVLLAVRGCGEERRGIRFPPLLVLGTRRTIAQSVDYVGTKED